MVGTLALASLPSLAQSPFVKIDVDPTLVGSSSSPQGMQVLQNVEGSSQLAEAAGGWFFTAHSDAAGRELYFTDGTAAGTLLLKDIYPGTVGSLVNEAVELNGKLIFAARDGVHGTELWTSDGTPAGTHLLADIEPGSFGTNPSRLTRVGQLVYFRAGRASTGFELYRTDGTAAGTGIVKDIQLGAASSNPKNLVSNAAGTQLLFQAHDGVHGSEIWASDGSPSGTQLLSDLEPGSIGAGFDQPMRLGADIVFTAGTMAEGVELFITDGTTAGTQLLADLQAGPFGSMPHLTAAGFSPGKLYFTAETFGTGRELFVTDGTLLGTGLVVDANIGPVGSEVSLLGALPTGLLMSMRLDPVNVGTELYRLTGSSVSLVKDLAPGTLTSGTAVIANSSSPKDALVQGGLAYFSAADDLWVSDGTTAGTQLVAENTTSADQRLTPVGGGSIVFAGASTTFGEELFVTDGTSAGTHLLVDLASLQVPFESQPKNFGVVGGDDFYFTSTQFGVGPTIRRWNKASGATLISSELASVATLAQTGPVVTSAWLGDHLDMFLFLTLDALDSDIFHTDGTEAGTSQVVDLGEVMISPLAANQSVLFLSVVDSAHGRELWTTDGTAAGTQMVMDINPGPLGSDLSAAIVLGDKLYFRGNDGVHGVELWVSDGTAAGTHMVADINPAGGSGPGELATFEGQLLFTAQDGVHGFEPWASDGTAAGTVMLADVKPGAANSKSVSFNTDGDVAYFFANSGPLLKRSLWQTDGTPAGTLEAASLVIPYSQPVASVFLNGKLYFEAFDALHGDELWSFDGTTAQMVVDSNPGLESGHASEMVAAGDKLYFVGFTPATGAELFVTDGTLAGTTLVGELVAGPETSAPSYVTLAAGGLMFTATGTDGDHELYRYELPHAHAVDLGFGGSEGALSVTAPVVGQTFVASVEGAPFGSLGLIGVSAPAGPSATLMLPANASWLDLATVSILGASMAPSWSASVAIPAGPGLMGLEVNAQAWFLPAGFAPAESSNGYRLVLGN